MTNYFTAEALDRVTFYEIPKAFFSDSRYKALSSNAKVLYAIMRDLSRNGQHDDNGKIYICYPLEEIQADLTISKPTATKVVTELEGCGLIVRKRRGLGKPNAIYVCAY